MNVTTMNKLGRIQLDCAILNPKAIVEWHSQRIAIASHPLDSETRSRASFVAPQARSAVQDRTASPAGSSIPRRIAKKSDLVCASADSAEAQMNAPVSPKDRACSAAEALAASHKGCG